MAECCNSSGYRHLFNQREARRNLRRYEAKGLDAMARRLVDELASRDLEGKSVLEVGGGIGAFHLELLEAGAADAVNVELSSGYDEVARELAERKGLVDRVERRMGDFTESAADLKADVVVMHRVICCYPHMERLMASAASSSRQLLAATFPPRNLVARLLVRLGNAWCRVSGVDFRAYVHPPEAILEAARRAGFAVAFRDRSWRWHAVVLERVA